MSGGPISICKKVHASFQTQDAVITQIDHWVSYSSRSEANLRSIPRANRQAQVLHPRARIPRFNLAELLQQSHSNICSFSQSILLSEAYVPSVNVPYHVKGSCKNVQILGPPLKGRYSQPGLRCSHRSGLNSSASSPYKSLRRCSAYG